MIEKQTDENRNGNMNNNESAIGKTGTLIIENVDFDMLERQRLTLQRVLSWGTPVEGKDREDLEGLENMLDEWSDLRALQKETFSG